MRSVTRLSPRRRSSPTNNAPLAVITSTTAVYTSGSRRAIRIRALFAETRLIMLPAELHVDERSNHLCTKWQVERICRLKAIHRQNPAWTAIQFVRSAAGDFLLTAIHFARRRLCWTRITKKRKWVSPTKRWQRDARFLHNVNDITEIPPVLRVTIFLGCLPCHYICLF